MPEGHNSRLVTRRFTTSANLAAGDILQVTEDGGSITEWVVKTAEKSSHTATGQINWMKDFTTSAITDMEVSGNAETIVVGDQDGKVHIINQFGIERQSVSAGPWINAVAVSNDGLVIAVGSLDRTLYILDGGGNQIATLDAESIIQPRSVAINR
jgi:WD40 repeat protein